MKRSLKTLASLVGGAVLSTSASAYDSLYIFGDSLSDTGNATQFAAAQGVQGRSVTRAISAKRNIRKQIKPSRSVYRVSGRILVGDVSY